MIPAITGLLVFALISAPMEPDDYELERVPGSYASPLHVVSPPDDSRLFVVERGGRVEVVVGNRPLNTPYVDISASITSGGERGLLGMAFHPDFSSNGRFFLAYTNAGATSWSANSVPTRAQMWPTLARWRR